jgi:hypothetical protein
MRFMVGVACVLVGAAVAVAESKPAPTQQVTVGTVDLKSAPVQKIALNRTPPLFDTDEPATPQIATVDVRALRASGKLQVQMTWRDASNDSATLESVPESRPETRFHKVPTAEDDRFFDAAAVMVPTNSRAAAATPSLQMGDAEDAVTIYYWNATRGAMRMEAAGRGTTRRTGQAFPAQGEYRNGQWTLTLDLPDLPAGTPVAFAVWNGSQKDRDGRKYFTVWQVLK